MVWLSSWWGHRGMLAVGSSYKICLILACLHFRSAFCRYNDTGEDDEESVVCSDNLYLYRCLSKLPRFVDQSLLRRMPVSESEINSLCRGFNMGMKCISKYSSKCLVPAKKQFLDRQISGAQRIFQSLCNDDSFRLEYLQHSVCLKDTQKNWDSCVNQFTQLMREEIQEKNVSHEAQMLQTCCAIHGFSRCIYVSGRFKCHKEAALFLLKMAEISIDHQEYLRDCHRISSYRVCIGCKCTFSASLLLFSYVFFTVVLRGAGWHAF